ncbi:lectin-like domain-containing protein [Schleiferilactobacillus shenzhenensis]|nr:hypothetical protein [Schleiferilactobacillus shenzhenensis]
MNMRHFAARIMALVLLSSTAALGMRLAAPVRAANDSVIVTTPDDTQNFWNAFGTANVAKDDNGKWASVTLTPAAERKAGAITLNNRMDLTRPFTLAFAANFGTQSQYGDTVAGDGISFGLYPGQLGAIGMFGGNLGVGAIPDLLGFKVDPYLNDDINFGADATYNDLAQALHITVPSTLNPLTNTVAFAKLFRDANSTGDVIFGSTDKARVPYGAFIQTTSQGWIAIPRAGGDGGFYGGRIDTPPTHIDYSYLNDGQWHGMQINYTVSADGQTGTLTIKIYRVYRANGQYNDAPYMEYQPRSGDLLGQWVRTVSIPTMTGHTAKKPYFAMNIAASTGSAFLKQQIKNLYASYTPEPGSMTSRFVDENGKSIRAAENVHDPDHVGDAAQLVIPGTIQETAADGKNTAYTYDYTTYQAFSTGTSGDQKVVTRLTPTAAVPGQPTATGTIVSPTAGGTDYTYHGQYKTAYQQIVTHYRRVATRPVITSTLAGQAHTSEKSASFLDKLSVQAGVPLTYTYQVQSPATGPNPWNGTHLTLTLPAGFAIAADQPVKAQFLSGSTVLTGSQPAIETGTTASGTTTLTVGGPGGSDLFGQSADSNGTAQATGLLVTVSLVPAHDNASGTITAALSDSYLGDYTTPAPPAATSYYTEYPVTIKHAINETEPTLAAQWIALTHRPQANTMGESHDFTAAELHKPDGVLIDPARTTLYPVTTAPPAHQARLTAADIVSAADTPLGGFHLTASGVQKLKANDDVQAAFQFTGTTDGATTTSWIVNYTLYEPQTTWMPDSGLRTLVANAFAAPAVVIDPDFFTPGQPITNTRPTHDTDGYPDELRKSDMTALHALTNAPAASGHPQEKKDTTPWNLRHDATGLEYATNLQALAIYGGKLLTDTDPDAATAAGTFRTLLPLLPKSLETLDLSGYDRGHDVFPAQASALPAATLAFPQLKNFNLVADELTAADLAADDGHGRFSDIGGVYRQNLPAGRLVQTNLSSLDEPDRLQNKKNVNAIGPIVTDANTALVIHQKNMLLAPAVDVPLSAEEKRLVMTVPVKSLQDVTQAALGLAGEQPRPDGPSLALAAYDHARSDVTSTNAAFPNLVKTAQPIAYADYAGTTTRSDDQFYLRRSVTSHTAGATTDYSSWTPAQISGFSALTVTPTDLDFGRRWLRAGSFPNDGVDETRGKHSDGPAATDTPVTVTVTRAGRQSGSGGDVTLAASPFTSRDGTSTILSWHLLFTAMLTGETYTVPANTTGANNGATRLGRTTFSAENPAESSRQYHVRLVIPDTTGIQTGNDGYSAALTYTYAPDTI